MNTALRIAFDTEIHAARELMREKRYDRAFHHLERAHILGQRFVVPHVVSHWLMLRVGIAQRAPVAAFGQAVRIVVGAIGSALGVLPIGNPGGSDVSMFATMPIPADLERLLDDDGSEAAVAID